MDLLLIRDPSIKGATIGALFIVNGEKNDFQCYTLEDIVRPDGVKVWGETAIPQGVYEVVYTFSPKFQKHTPALQAVPGFDGIRIHPGNTADHTHGCILVGQERQENTISGSRAAYDALINVLFPAWEHGGQVWLTIR